MARERIALRFAVAGREHDYSALTRPLLRALERTHDFAVEIAHDP